MHTLARGATITNAGSLLARPLGIAIPEIELFSTALPSAL
jgi:hypothetical protein